MPWGGIGEIPGFYLRCPPQFSFVILKEVNQSQLKRTQSNQDSESLNDHIRKQKKKALGWSF